MNANAGCAYDVITLQTNDNSMNIIISFRWNYVVTLVPMWVAPNLITIVGLAINMCAALLLIQRCPSATEEVCVVAAKE